MSTRSRIAAKEAIAYAKSGVLQTLRRPVRKSNGHVPELGVLFVHGVGSSPSQFRALRLSLDDHVHFFDAFEYRTWTDLERTAGALAEHIGTLESRCDRLVLIGHSLGGVLSRIVLQAEQPPQNVAGFVSICAPLAGTRVSRLAPNRSLRALRPSSALIQQLEATADRLDRLQGAVLSVGATRDHFVSPSTSAFLDGHDALRLDHAGHVSSLFEAEVHGAVRQLILRVERATQVIP